MMCRPTLLLFLTAAAVQPAAAQPPDSPHGQSLAGGAQWALPYSGHGDKPGGLVSWRRWTSVSFGIGSDFRWWGRKTTVEFGSSGVRAEDWVSSYGLGVDVLARTSIGRLSVIGGVGPGFFVERRRYARQANGTLEAGSETLSSFGVHSLAEVEVRVTRRLAAFASLRMELRDVRAAGSSSGYPAAGIRFFF